MWVVNETINIYSCLNTVTNWVGIGTEIPKSHVKYVMSNMCRSVLTAMQYPFIGRSLIGLTCLNSLTREQDRSPFPHIHICIPLPRPNYNIESRASEAAQRLTLASALESAT